MPGSLTIVVCKVLRGQFEVHCHAVRPLLHTDGTWTNAGGTDLVFLDFFCGKFVSRSLHVPKTDTEHMCRGYITYLSAPLREKRFLRAFLILKITN